MLYPAHIRDDGSIQTVADHCRETAELSRASLQDIGLGESAYLCGLLHDAGKCKNEFRDYITKASKGEKVTRGSVQHTFAAVRYLLTQYHRKPDSAEDPITEVTAEILASATGGHHELFDCFDEDGNCGFTHRIDTEAPDSDRAMDAFWTEDITREKADKLFLKSTEEIGSILQIIKDSPLLKPEENFFRALITRLLTSALIDADRMNTASFMTGGAVFDGIVATKDTWRNAGDHLDDYLKTFASDTPIRAARKELSEECFKAARKPGGIYRLNLPTGAGKTLSGLRYALKHAEEFGKERIFFISPLLTILEQNAAEIRRAVGDDSIILEHHSDVVTDGMTEDEICRQEQLTDTWNSPIVITTLVQLLNTLFGGKTSSVRRFHALSNSVIVIDEVQTVPTKMLSLFNTAMNFLVSVCHTTVVLCSATQPEFGEVRHPLLPCEDIVCPHILKKHEAVFQRNRLIDKGKHTLDEIPGLIAELFTEFKSVLVVCNKKAQASELLHLTKGVCSGRYHLSAGMCTAHRKSVLNEVRRELNAKSNVLCISTQVIEAGVDISFDAVIRLSAGLDSIVQTAGRCNRNGENGSDAPVWIVNLQDEDLSSLKEIDHGKDTTESLVQAFNRAPERFDYKLSSEEAIRFYYQKLYVNNTVDACDYPKAAGKLSLYKLISKGFSEEKERKKYRLHGAYKTAGELFHVFDKEQKSVVVPWKDGESIIEELKERGNRITKADVDRVKPYTVSLFGYSFDELKKCGAICEVADTGIYTLDKEYYDDNIGVVHPTKGEKTCDTLIL